MDHYKVLGVQKNASKEEIKRAFRKLAMEFHPDKHSHSSNNLRNSATQKFKQLSEAYEVLMDDHKRADYNLKRNAYGTHQSRRYDHRYGGGGGGGYGHSYSYSYSYSNTRSSGYGFSGARTSSGSDGFAKLEMFMHFLKKRRFAINASLLALPCIMLGGAFIVDSCGKALWKMRNTGKSFEEAMDSIERAKADKDSSY